MSQSVRDLENSKEAAADLSAKQYYFVKVDTSGKIALAAAATDAIVGVLQNTPASGEQATYRFGGTAKIVLGGTVDEGEWVTSDSNGKGVATTTDGNIAVRALEAGVAGDIIEVQLPMIPIYIA